MFQSKYAILDIFQGRLFYKDIIDHFCRENLYNLLLQSLSGHFYPKGVTDLFTLIHIKKAKNTFLNTNSVY